jgi:hypothetical protein
LSCHESRELTKSHVNNQYIIKPKAHNNLQIIHINHTDLPSEHPVAKSSEDFEEPAEETSQVMALTHDL